MQSCRKNSLTLTPPSFSLALTQSSRCISIALQKKKKEHVGGFLRRLVTLSCGAALDSTHGRHFGGHWHGERRLTLGEDSLNDQCFYIGSSEHIFRNTTDDTRVQTQLLCNRPTASKGKDLSPESSSLLHITAHHCSRLCVYRLCVYLYLKIFFAFE